MSMWHAYASQAALGSGVELLVTGGDEPVELQTGDQLTIEMPDNNQCTVVVVSRTGNRILLAAHEGAQYEIVPGESEAVFEDFQLSEGFSRQFWTVR